MLLKKYYKMKVKAEGTNKPFQGLSYLWFFDNTGPVVSHTFKCIGTYTIVLTVVI